ncbi:type VII toxin-antitoxin system MntA family adenylyltransferase antitoxin [Geoalkalibacter subterraneus]|uniref:type VII toxin-antitoxin system MntA family adenylyltransferase antitoxin n=1 Tax=Geoalkalibacter subterraneus TaxID=483547 RepID=UPI000694DDDB|nr:nucleotidyltransferase domain-containing protein [Geoalkalibacter subterraneus]
MDHMIVQCLREAVPRLLAVYRFGSFGTEGEHPASDLDIAFLAEASPSRVQRWRLAQEMATRFGRDVDLIDLAQATTVFRMQVIAHGRRIWCV